MGHNTIIHVAIPHTGRDFYDYTCQDRPLLGARVVVPFHRKQVIGIVIGAGEVSTYTGELKALLEVLDETPVISAALLTFYQWVARYYHARLTDVLYLALPKKFRVGHVLMSALPQPVIRSTSKLILLPEQQTAVECVRSSFGQYACFMLQGVTGSGKTEVYLRLCADVIALGQQVLILVPEIGLTSQWVERFCKYLGTSLAVIHSYLSDTVRFTSWCAAATGQSRVVLGTRSALFTPMPQLGLIIVDEEHDVSFKQQDHVRYSARDAALMRAKQTKIPIILGSATPSLETYYHAQREQYHRLTLTRKALHSPDLRFEWVDLRKHTLKEGLADYTYQKIADHLKAQHQVLVFINRRGFAPVLLCHGCGHIADCPACERHLTVHKQMNILICHHCGLQTALITTCKACGSATLILVGVGTQRLVQALQERFPKITLVQMDKDALRKKEALAQALQAIVDEKAQLIVGTQLIAKGHHFPRLTLVIIADADAGLYHQDFRALERLGQLLLQVSGRAGRATLPGEVLIQTHFPHHPLLNTLVQEGYDAFAKALLTQRAHLQLPPYVHLALICAKSRQISLVEKGLNQLKQYILDKTALITLYGPALALQPKKAHYYHMQLCLMTSHRAKLHDALHKLKCIKWPIKGVTWYIDVDPID